MARAKLRRGVELVKLANRIEALKAQEEDPENSDFPEDATAAADESSRSGILGMLRSSGSAPAASSSERTPREEERGEKKSLKAVKGAIFREVVLAKVREMRQEEETRKVTEQAEKEAKDRATF